MAQQLDTKTDAELEKQISKLFDRWGFLVADRGYRFELKFFRNHLDSDGWLKNAEHVSMRCRAIWKHQHAIISVNLSNCKRDSVTESELEWTVVHELVHILMGECSYDDISMEERTCSEITSAIIQTSKIYFEMNK